VERLSSGALELLEMKMQRRPQNHLLHGAAVVKPE